MELLGAQTKLMNDIKQGRSESLPTFQTRFKTEMQRLHHLAEEASQQTGAKELPHKYAEENSVQYFISRLTKDNQDILFKEARLNHKEFTHLTWSDVTTYFADETLRSARWNMVTKRDSGSEDEEEVD